jgi:chromosomal replication initiation ATPase DnaA
MIAKPKADLETRMALAVSLINAMSRRIDTMEAELISLRCRIAPRRKHTAATAASAAARAMVDAVIAEAAGKLGVPEVSIRGSGRTAPVAAARQWVYHEASIRGLSDPAIGRVLGRHHSTIRHGRSVEAARRLQNGAEGV